MACHALLGAESLPAGPGVSKKLRQGSGRLQGLLYYFYVLDGGRMKAMLPKHGESTTERIKCRRVYRASSS